MTGQTLSGLPLKNIAVAAGLGTAAAMAVWATYFPADATEVEHGRALGVSLALMLWTLVAALTMTIKPRLNVRRASWWLDVSVLGLAAWIFLAAWVTGGYLSASPPEVGGDVRAATNEAWWWIGAAGFFVVIRRMMSATRRVGAIFGLLFGLGTLLAVHTLHQYFLSLPETMREYLRDPDAALASVGMDAPAGSAARMIYENRLRDGGPTATFALANSLAGPLAMIATLSGGCLIGMLSAFRSGPQVAEFAGSKPSIPFPIVRVSVAGLVFGLMMVALLTTGSRSGVMSVAMVAMMFTFSSIWTRTGRPTRVVLAGLVGLGMVAIVTWWHATGDSQLGELASGARATIALRLQYWRSTLGLVLDHPWFGAGPGNFQLVYQKYRDVQGHEMIAEPHNFILETLACGGWIATGLLAIGAIAGCLVYRRTMSSRSADCNEEAKSLDVPGETTTRPPSIPRRSQPVVVVAIAVGAFIGLLAVWYYGILSGELPDFEAHLYAIPCAIVVMAAWWMSSPPQRTFLSGRPCQRIAAWASACGLVHLCFSSGWTIPGVSLLLVWIAGIATSEPEVQTVGGVDASASVVARNAWRPRLALGLIGSILILAMVFISFRPVMRTRAAMADAAMRMQTNRGPRAETILNTVVQNDPFAQDAAIWLAGIENRKSMQAFVSSGTPSAAQIRITEKAFDTAIVRAGNNPTRLRAIGELLLQRYQVVGRVDDLVRSEEIFARAIELSPTQEVFIAQQSEIVRELTARGLSVEGQSAGDLAERAETLASSGGMVTRDLELQPILPARPLGPIALGAPVRTAAADLLRTQSDGST